MLAYTIIIIILTAILLYVWHRYLMLQAIELIELMRDRVMYPMDVRIATSKRVSAFIRRHK